MAKIRTLSAIQVSSGQRLGLTPAQAGARTHLLKHIDKDVYELKQIAQFKAGEELVWVGDLPKHYHSQVEVLDKPVVKRSSKRAADPSGDAASGTADAPTDAPADDSQQTPPAA